ncbi:MAG: carbohydrate ABC transporter permease [Ruminiclostridium sp.]|nr:carbohydrate ABC transporter permease [Ruminiclostridium sp.]
MLFFIIPMYFSGGLIPSYLVNRALGFRDSLLVYIVPTMFSAFIMLIVRNYLMTMEKALEEAAFIDGASVIQVLFMVIIPLSKPVLATVALWQMVDQWNAWVDNMIYIRDENKYVLQFILRRLIESSAQTEQAMMYYSTNRGVKLATAQVQAAITLIVLLPIVCVYPFLQKYFVKGIILGAVKG